MFHFSLLYSFDLFLYIVSWLSSCSCPFSTMFDYFYFSLCTSVLCSSERSILTICSLSSLCFLCFSRFYWLGLWVSDCFFEQFSSFCCRRTGINSRCLGLSSEAKVSCLILKQGVNFLLPSPSLQLDQTFMFQLFQGLAQMKDYFKAQTKPSFSATERLQSDICVHDEHLFGFHHFSENQKKMLSFILPNIQNTSLKHSI